VVAVGQERVVAADSANNWCEAGALEVRNVRTVTIQARCLCVGGRPQAGVPDRPIQGGETASAPADEGTDLSPSAVRPGKFDEV